MRDPDADDEPLGQLTQERIAEVLEGNVAELRTEEVINRHVGSQWPRIVREWYEAALAHYAEASEVAELREHAQIVVDAWRGRRSDITGKAFGDHNRGAMELGLSLSLGLDDTLDEFAARPQYVRHANHFMAFRTSAANCHAIPDRAQ